MSALRLYTPAEKSQSKREQNCSIWHQRQCDTSDGANSYYGIAKTCCEKWGIPYLDLNTQTPPLRYIDALRTAYTLSGDGIHPNADGYRLFYVPKITAFLKGL